MYIIEDVIGSGGMSTVYKVRRDQSRRKHKIKLPSQALKVMIPHFLQDEDARERFVQEALTLIPISHRGLINIQSIVCHKNQLGILMDYIPGVTLRDWNPEYTLDQYKDFLFQLCSAIDELHSKGIIHRDLKPENILVREDGTPCIIDLGVAKSNKLLVQTATGTFLGSLKYAPIEQINGDIITPSVDRYALGILIYEMLTGRYPWEGTNHSAIIACKYSDALIDIQSLLPDLPVHQAQTIMRLLHREPSERFSSAEEFFHALYSTQFRTISYHTSFANPSDIGVLGMGGCGTNMLDSLDENIHSFAFNSDIQHLRSTRGHIKVPFGVERTNGLGTGGDLNEGWGIAEDNHNVILETISPYNTIVLLAGLGGGMGTGASPYVAQLAKEHGKAVIALVTEPFFFEGRKRRYVAEEGKDQLLKMCDTVVVFSNDALMKEEDATLQESFQRINTVVAELLSQCAKWDSEELQKFISRYPTLCRIESAQKEN